MNLAIIFSALSDIPFTPLLWLLGGIALAAVWVWCLKGWIEDGNRYARQSDEILKQLNAAIEDTRKLANQKLAGNPQKLAQVEDLLQQATRHTHPPVCDAFAFYSIYMVTWHRGGLEYVKQAQALIEA